MRIPSAVLLAAILGLPTAAASDLRLDPSNWILCGTDPLLPFFRADLPRDGARDGVPAEVSAVRFNVLEQQRYVLDGDVELLRLDQFLRAPRLTYDHDAQSYVAEGPLEYQDRDLLLSAARAEGNLARDESTLDDVRYALIDLRGNGQARQIARRGETSALRELTYSTCPPADRRWELKAGTLDIDHAEGVGRATRVSVRVGRVPLLYLPYASFPIDDRRRSGFLYPRLGYDANAGIDLALPYYWNIAPNYDATVTTRLIGQRGVMLGGEFRYLFERHRGELSGSWMPDDDLAGRDRGSFTYRHNGRLSQNWIVQADLNHVSDPRYFEDFGDSLAARSASLLESRALLRGRGQFWNAMVALQRWEITDPFLPDSAEPYRRLPRAVFGWDQPFGEFLNVGLRSEAVAFDHDTLASGQRLDLYPYLRFGYERAGGFLRSELGYRYTGYHLDRDFRSQLPGSSPDRALPVFSLDSGLVFERPASLFGHAVSQTLEPRLFYLRVPYEDQSDIPVFDTRALDFSFPQLFRTNRFSGADRQSDANQLTVALSTRFYEDDSGRERLSASLGRVFYFDPPRVELPGVPVLDRDGSAYVGELAVALSQRWSLALGHQYDPETRRSELSTVRAGYRTQRGDLANIAYRYRRNLLEQIDTSFIVPINDRWRLIGRWNYSLVDSTSVEALGGFEWNDCCIALRVLARHYVRNREGEKNNALFFELELKGLGSFGRSADDYLERAILGYTR